MYLIRDLELTLSAKIIRLSSTVKLAPHGVICIFQKTLSSPHTLNNTSFGTSNDTINTPNTASPTNSLHLPSVVPLAFNHINYKENWRRFERRTQSYITSSRR
ncbi:hypothetical protein PILCRDRAFT_596368 [Piloderma croceum F 1598]|uniref:Uncharacterized protein n=1 Tax=Piloderma croceum (strain F 1598) TaxID=765440 RepID=A0A0C3FEH6_PILCF|nr:hypothetical protein PILCRDRAFT_725252 [Piloderma croceum F 1598]KIM78369.1 hypothetical protein PILCRDRAFT_596368 [Piloderma croceum F 1598]